MKYFYILFALFPLNIFAQNTVVDSIFTDHCITQTSMGTLHNDDFVDSVSSIYNGSGQLIVRRTSSTSIRDGSVTYYTSSMDSLLYDSVANSIETISGDYYNSVFNPRTARKVTYDNFGNIIFEQLAPVYPNYTQFFANVYLPNNLIDYTMQYTDASNPLDSMLIDYSYDGNWNLILRETFVYDNGMIARPYEKKVQYFNAGNQLLGYNWYIWVDSTFGYDPCYFDTSTFTYFASGLLATQTQRSCGSFGYVTTWYSYDVNNNLDSSGFYGINSSGDYFSRSCDAGDGLVIDGIGTHSDKGQFVLYPNPSNGRVKLKGNFTDVIDEIKIIDLSGRIVLTKKVAMTKDSTFEVDLSELSSGVYVMQVFDGGVRSVLFVRE